MIPAQLILSWFLRVDPWVRETGDTRDLAQAISDVSARDNDPVESATILVAIGKYESHFNIYAVSSPDDTTSSVGAFQVSTQWLLFPASPEMQADVALWLVHDSLRACGSLAQYTSGTCGAGLVEATRRWKLAKRLRAQTFVEGQEPCLPAHRRKDGS